MILSPSSLVPEARIRAANRAPERPEGDYVLYWMIAQRRLDSNFALQRAVERARALDRPLVILEALRADYPWASARFHRFVLDGMAENAARLAGSNVLYHPYVEPRAGAGAGLLEALAERACLVVTDEYPTFFLPRMVAAGAARVPVRLEVVDGNGLLPLRCTEHAFSTAHSFRAFLQRELPAHLESGPRHHPLRGSPLPPLARLPADIGRRWPRASDDLLSGDAAALARLPIDHRVGPVSERGGSRPARERLRRFLDDGLYRYGDRGSAPEAAATSGLSPWLHFGHISAHEVFEAVLERDGWSPADLAEPLGGQRHGWWGAAECVEAFLDQLVVWRELGFNACWHRVDHDRLESLPNWALATLFEHASDPRPHLYDLAELEAGDTHDPLWNAAQGQLRAEGHIHNTMRMLWGKKILEWTESPERALDFMIELNNKWALDGRDPNSCSGILWVLGRYDRAWGPERPVFGKIRYMSSENTARKFRVDDYVARFAGQPRGGRPPAGRARAGRAPAGRPTVVERMS